jgi:hypothetical protein
VSRKISGNLISHFKSKYNPQSPFRVGIKSTVFTQQI